MGKEGQVFRPRLTIPVNDTSVLEWFEAQSNPSMAMRLLIKQDISKNGCTDVTCRPVEQERRGRPVDTERTEAPESEPSATVTKGRKKSGKPSVVAEKPVVQEAVAVSQPEHADTFVAKPRAVPANRQATLTSILD